MGKTFSLLFVFLGISGILAAQPVIGGLKIGAPLTDAFNIANSPSLQLITANANDYTLGPFVEVKLPFKFSIEGDALYRGYNFGIAGQSNADRVFHRPAVEPGQRAGITQGDGAYMRIGLAAKAGGIATEKLRPGKQLGMDLEPYDYFVCIIALHPANLSIYGRLP